MTLKERVQDFDIDGAQVAFPFVERLARENGWTKQYAERVVVEYKRFIVMAMESSHIVTPSEAVDQAWHLHLCYTHSYWDRLCKEVLERSLHHNPTQGGKTEERKYWDAYQETLKTYTNIFGEAPPQDIWPMPEKRFDTSNNFRWINTKHHWVIPKMLGYSVGRGLIALLICLVLLAGCATNNLLNDILTAYAGIIIVAVVIIVVVLLIALVYKGKGGRGGGNGGGCSSFFGCGFGSGCNASSGCSGGSGCGGGGCGGD